MPAFEPRTATVMTPSPQPTEYSSKDSKSAETSTSIGQLPRRDAFLCWAVEDSGNEPALFCSCSNSQTYSTMTQAPASTAAFEICGYSAYPSATNTEKSARSSMLLDLNQPSFSSLTPLVSPYLDSGPISTSNTAIPSASGTPGILLWGQCAQSPKEVCAGEAQCICKDAWWSQCRLPLNGSWTPTNETWQCNGPYIAESSPSASLPTSTSQIASIGALNSSPNSSSGVRTSSPTGVVYSLTTRHSVDVSAALQTSSMYSSGVSSFRSLSSSPALSASTTAPKRHAGFDHISIFAAEPSSSSVSLPIPSMSSKITILSPILPNASSHSTTLSSTLGSNATQSATSSSRSTSNPASTALPSLHQNHTSGVVDLTTSLLSKSATTQKSVQFSVTNSHPPTTTSAPWPSSTLSRPDYGRFVISIPPQPPQPHTSPIAPLPNASVIISKTVNNGLSESSTSSLLPNLACPSHASSGEDEDISDGFHAIASQACDPNSPGSPGDLFSIATSSATANVPMPTSMDPDKYGVYLDSKATLDQQTACQNFAAHQYQVCWEILNVTGYIQDWVSFNLEKCNEEDMGFADCFAYIEVEGGQNCTAFTGRSQCDSPDPRTFVGRTHGAQAYYVAFNVWNIQNWFFTYYLAVQGANGLASDNVNTIVRTLNVPIPPSFPIQDLLAALAFAFGLLSPSGYAAVLPRIGEKVGAQAPGEYLLRAIQNSPTLSRNIVASGDLSQTDVQVAQLGSDLARIVSQLETNIQNAVVMVLSNFSMFFDFVQDGFFSTQIDNLNTIAVNVTLSLNTYLVSQALQDDKVIITRAVDTDVNELQLNGSAVNLDTGCGYGYDEWGMCGSWWYDSTNHITYGLESLKDMLNNYTDPLKSLFNQGITTPELLFINSQVCADASGSTQGSAPGTSLSTTIGVWNTECISNLKICSWDLVNLGVFNEFIDCGRESAFAMEPCGDGEDTVQVTVPASYIGPYMTDSEFQGQVCNHWGKGMGSPG